MTAKDDGVATPQPGAGVGSKEKRAYERPQLIDYGPIAHLTRGDGGGNDFDGASNMAMLMSAM